MPLARWGYYCRYLSPTVRRAIATYDSCILPHLAVDNLYCLERPECTPTVGLGSATGEDSNHQCDGDRRKRYGCSRAADDRNCWKPNHLDAAGRGWRWGQAGDWRQADQRGGQVQDERAGVAMRQDYQFQLWLASGITSVRDVGSNFEKSNVWRAKSAAGEIAAPRLFLYPVFGLNPPPSAAGEAAIHARMKEIKVGGADGMKFFEISAWAMKIMQEDAHALGIRTAHHAAVAGTTTIGHWYGIPDAAPRNGVQDFPADFNHQYQVDRFRHAGHLFRQADPENLVEVLSGMVKAGVAWSPTLSIYEAARDLVRYQCQPFFAPDPNNHGSLGGTLVVREDAGFIYNLFGFKLIREMERRCCEKKRNLGLCSQGISQICR